MVLQNEYDAKLAIDQNGNRVANAEAEVFARADTTFSTPLAITDTQGVPMAKLVANGDGIYPSFVIPSGELQVTVKSGSALTPMTSLMVYATVAEQAAGTASLNAGAADAARSSAETARSESQQAATQAQVAAAKAEAVGTTNDTVVRGLVAGTGVVPATTTGDTETGLALSRMRAELRAYSMMNSQVPGARSALCSTTAGQATVTAVPYPIKWDLIERMTDGGLHSTSSSSNTKFTCGRGKWRACGAIEFAAGTGSRAVDLYIGGVLARKGARVPAAPTGTTVVPFDITFPVNGDPVDVEIVATQDSGGALNIVSGKTGGGPMSGGGTYIDVTRVGALNGIRTDAAASAVNILFDGNVPLRGLARYAGQSQTINPQRAFPVPDPAIGGENNQVVLFDVRSSDIGGGYPRSQLASPSNLSIGGTFCDAMALLLTDDFTFDTEPKMILEIYGPPFGAGGPNRVYIVGDELIVVAGGVITDRLWVKTLVRNKFYYLARRIKLSTDPAVGSLELFFSEDAATPLTAQTLAGVTTYPYASVVTGVNSGGNNYSTIKLSYGVLSGITRARGLLVKNHRTGGSNALDLIDPRFD